MFPGCVENWFPRPMMTGKKWVFARETCQKCLDQKARESDLKAEKLTVVPLQVYWLIIPVARSRCSALSFVCIHHGDLQDNGARNERDELQINTILTLWPTPKRGLRTNFPDLASVYINSRAARWIFEFYYKSSWDWLNKDLFIRNSTSWVLTHLVLRTLNFFYDPFLIVYQ